MLTTKAFARARQNMPIKSTIKVAGATVLVLLLLFCALGPAKWQYRTGLGWQIDHVVGYFGFTLMFCLAWPRPIVVGGALMASAMLLEALQALTPDRCCAGCILRRRWGSGGGRLC